VIPRGVEIFVALDPIDLRWGFDRLCGVVTERLGRRARSGALFVFFGRRRTAAKVLFCDRTGVCVFYKRLDTGTFRVPEPAIEGDVARLIDERAFDDLIDGIDITPTTPRRRVH
jgi:transposase